MVYDFFIGCELKLRWTLPLGIGEVDLKAWLGRRPGLISWNASTAHSWRSNAATMRNSPTASSQS